MSDKQNSAVTEAQKQAKRQVVTLRTMLEQSKSQIQAALPKHMDADRLLRVAMTSVQKTPDLLTCDPISVVRSVIEAAQLGLEPDGILGHAYLVPYKKKCQLIVGYKGMISLAYRSGMVASVGGQVVYDKDRFDVAFGIDEKLHHVPNFEETDRGKPVCVYAVAHMKGGGHAFVVLSMAEVERHRQRSAMPNSPAWKNDFEAMAVKTAVRVLSKWMPQCPELQRAVGKEEAIEAGADVGDTFIDITDSQVSDDKPESRAEQVSRDLKAKKEDDAKRKPQAAKGEKPAEPDDAPTGDDSDDEREPGDDDEDVL